jgi:hypothetical protein
LASSRFSREGVLETLNHLQRLAAYGVGYRSFTEQYLDSCGVFKDAVLSARLRPRAGNPQALSHAAETDENPRGVWTLKKLQLIG